MKQKYKVCGKLKPLDEQRPCITCKDGDIFNKPYFKFDLYAPNDEEPICSACMTKYKIPRFNLVNHHTGRQTIKDHIEQNWEVYKMTPETLDLRKIYEQTKECPKHELKPSKPFATALGTFIIRSCPVCSVGQVDYNGKTFQAPTMELLNWIGKESIEFDRKQKALDSKMISLGITLNQEPKKVSDKLLNLFSAPTLSKTNPLLESLFN